MTVKYDLAYIYGVMWISIPVAQNEDPCNTAMWSWRSYNYGWVASADRKLSRQYFGQSRADGGCWYHRLIGLDYLAHTGACK